MGLVRTRIRTEMRRAEPATEVIVQLLRLVLETRQQQVVVGERLLLVQDGVAIARELQLAVLNIREPLDLRQRTIIPSAAVFLVVIQESHPGNLAVADDAQVAVRLP